MNVQDRRKILEKALEKFIDEEKTAEAEMLDLLSDRKERDERRRLAEIETLRRQKAAIIIQKVWRGYAVRKKLKRKKKKGKKGKKGKSKGSKKATTKGKTSSKKRKKWNEGRMIQVIGFEP